METIPTTKFDWGDGTLIEVKRPDLSGLRATMCPVPCFPEGDEGTGQVINSKTFIVTDQEKQARCS